MKKFIQNKLCGLPVVVYDAEIKRVIDTDGSERQYDFVTSWNDYKGMGISMVGAYDAFLDRYRVFDESNRDELVKLFVERNSIVGFNQVAFDNELLFSCGWLKGMVKTGNKVKTPIYQLVRLKSYDIFREISKVAGIGTMYNGRSHRGLGLDAVYKRNVDEGGGKTDKGANAPILYQTQQFGKLYDYCLNDVGMTADIFNVILVKGGLISPQNGSILDLKIPHEIFQQKELWDVDNKNDGVADVDNTDRGDSGDTDDDMKELSDALDIVDFDDI